MMISACEMPAAVSLSVMRPSSQLPSRWYPQQERAKPNQRSKRRMKIRRCTGDGTMLIFLHEVTPAGKAEWLCPPVSSAPFSVQACFREPDFWFFGEAFGAELRQIYKASRRISLI